MSYCRFQNTLEDLQDCSNYITDDSLSREEERARENLVDLCRYIVEEWESMEEEEQHDE
jgi:hypothetical protein